MNPYKILGIPKTSAEHQIKNAFRKKAKKLHPDVGGDAAKFDELQQAYDLLMDPERRAHYDATGEVRAKAPDNEFANMANALNPLFDRACKDAVNRGYEPQRVDLIGLIRIYLEEHIQGAERQRQDIIKTKAILEKLAGRFNTAAPQNVFDAMIRHRITLCDQNLAQAEASKKHWTQVADFLAKYRFNMETLQGSGIMTVSLSNVVFC